MNVFIKKLAAWDLMRTLGSENCGRVNQADAGALACYGTNHVIQLAVSAKAKSVEILRAHETLFGPGEVTDSPETTSDAKLELCILRIDICGRKVQLEGLGVRSRIFKSRGMLDQSLPGIQFIRPDELNSWEGLVQHAAALENAGSYSEALQLYFSAADIDPQYAELQFRIARCLWAIGDFAGAKERFVRAQDLDTLRFRADS